MAVTPSTMRRHVEKRVVNVELRDRNKLAGEM